MSAETLVADLAAAATLVPDIEDARRFLELLDPEADEFTFQVFDDSPGKDERKARIYHGSLDREARRLIRAQSEGCGAFVTVNETDGRGRKAENITRIRAVFGDLDGAPLEPVLTCALAPHIIVESSTNRYHVYWLVDDLPLAEFGSVQRAIAGRFGGDEVHDLPRVMRLPGFRHLKYAAAPFQSKIVRVTEASPYPAERVLAEFPPAPAKSNGARGHATGEVEKMAELVRRVLAAETYHDALRSLAWRYIDAGMPPGQAVETLRGLMLNVPEEDRDDRWRARYNDIPRAVSGAQDKHAGAENNADNGSH